MIENIRKYTGLMIVVLVVLFVGLVFFGASAKSTLTGDSVMQIDSKSITPKEYQRLAVNAQSVPSFFSPYTEGGATLNRANYILGAGNPEDPEATSRYLANRYAVRQAGLDYGVTPDLNEVQRYIREVLFTNEDSSFDQKRYDDFLSNQLGRLGMNSRDFNEILTDLLTANNLLNLVGAGLSPDLEMTRALYEDSAQTIDVDQILFPRAQYNDAIKPTEEEVKAYWEKNKAKYLTAEQRKVTYILAEPNWDEAVQKVEAAQKKADEMPAADDKTAADKPSDVEEEEEEEEEIGEENDDILPGSEPSIELPDLGTGPDSPADFPITPAIPNAFETRSSDVTLEVEEENTEPTTPIEEPKSDEPATAKEKLSPEQRIDAVKSLNSIIDDFWQTVYDAKGAKFEKIAEDFKFTPVKTEMFTLADAPEILKSSIDGERGGTVAQRVFRTDPKGSLEDRVSDVFRTEEGYIIFRLDGTIPAEELKYEDAKELATADLKVELAIEAMKKDAEAKHDALKKALADGKSPEDAAKELGLTLTSTPNLTHPPSQFGYAAPAPPSFILARRLKPGEVSELKTLPSPEEPLSMMMVILKDRKIVADEAYQTGLDQLYQQHQQSLEIMAFQNWLNEQYIKNDVRAAK